MLSLCTIIDNYYFTCYVLLASCRWPSITTPSTHHIGHYAVNCSLAIVDRHCQSDFYGLVLLMEGGGRRSRDLLVEPYNYSVTFLWLVVGIKIIIEIIVDPL